MDKWQLSLSVKYVCVIFKYSFSSSAYLLAQFDQKTDFWQPYNIRRPPTGCDISQHSCQTMLHCITVTITLLFHVFWSVVPLTRLMVPFQREPSVCVECYFPSQLLWAAPWARHRSESSLGCRTLISNTVSWIFAVFVTHSAEQVTNTVESVLWSHSAVRIRGVCGEWNLKYKFSCSICQYLVFSLNLHQSSTAADHKLSITATWSKALPLTGLWCTFF